MESWVAVREKCTNFYRSSKPLQKSSSYIFEGNTVLLSGHEVLCVNPWQIYPWKDRPDAARRGDLDQRRLEHEGDVAESIKHTLVSIMHGGEKQISIKMPDKEVVYYGAVCSTQRYACPTCHHHVVYELSPVDVFCILASQG